MKGDSVLLNTSGQSTDSRQTLERVEDDMRHRLKKLNELTGLAHQHSGIWLQKSKHCRVNSL